MPLVMKVREGEVLRINGAVIEFKTKTTIVFLSPKEETVIETVRKGKTDESREV